jgi:adenylate kinase family enzyme
MRSSSLPDRIHILGASGSGTTTLAAAVAAAHGHHHLDTDDFYWLPTDPPYRTKRPRAARLERLSTALAASSTWILSGLLCGWGDPLIPRFQLIVFLTVPTDVRMRRLRTRELSVMVASRSRRGDASMTGTSRSSSGLRAMTRPMPANGAGRCTTPGSAP